VRAEIERLPDFVENLHGRVQDIEALRDIDDPELEPIERGARVLERFDKRPLVEIEGGFNHRFNPGKGWADRRAATP
jgi:hypothetical protein